MLGRWGGGEFMQGSFFICNMLKPLFQNAYKLTSQSSLTSLTSLTSQSSKPPQLFYLTLSFSQDFTRFHKRSTD